MIGIDAADKAITVAKQHAAESPELKLHYEHITVEEMLEKHTEKHVEKHAENSISTENGDPDGMDAEFDILTCMEMLEHIPDPAKLVQDCAQLVKPGGHLFFSTINRNLKSWVLAIIAAEYVMKLLPKGTHTYEKFIRPSEFAAWARAAKLQIVQISGFSYNPFTRDYRLSSKPEVNYLVHCRRGWR